VKWLRIRQPGYVHNYTRKGHQRFTNGVGFTTKSLRRTEKFSVNSNLLVLEFTNVDSVGAF
jgi:hypothetical protein